jgi:hypothetical protein
VGGGRQSNHFLISFFPYRRVVKKVGKIFFCPEPEETKIQYFGQSCITIFAIELDGQSSLPTPIGLAWVPFYTFVTIIAIY